MFQKKSLLLILLLCSISVTAKLHKSHHNLSEIDTRIINGEEANEERYRFVSALVNDYKGYFCAGTYERTVGHQ